MRIVFDENVPDCIVDALTSLSTITFTKDLIITSVSLLKLNGKPDEKILHAVGKSGILITYDKDFKKQKTLYAIIKEYEIGVFWVRQPTSKTLWLLAQLMVAKWQDILKIAENENKPFIYEVTKTGISKVNVFN